MAQSENNPFHEYPQSMTDYHDSLQKCIRCDLFKELTGDFICTCDRKSEVTMWRSPNIFIFKLLACRRLDEGLHCSVLLASQHTLFPVPARA